MVDSTLNIIRITLSDYSSSDGNPSLLLFSALSMPPFRSVKVRNKKPNCPACGTEGERMGSIEEMDYVAFCGGAAPDWETRGLIDAQDRLTPIVRSTLSIIL